MPNGTASAPPSVALIRAEAAAPNPYEPRDYREAQIIAKDFAASKMAKAVRTPEQAILIMATGHELGIPATTALRSIHVIEDVPTLSADLMVALCLRRTDLCEYFDCVSTDADGVTYATRRKGRAEQTFRFTIEDAKREGLYPGKSGSNWQKNPIGMCGHRAASRLARRVYPDILAGFYTADEVIEARAAEPVAPVQPLPDQVVDAEVMGPALGATRETRAASTEKDRLIVELSAKLDAARSQAEGDAIAREITKAFPDKDSAERAMFRVQLAARKKANWSAPAPESEPAHDPATGEVTPAREPGEEG